MGWEVGWIKLNIKSNPSIGKKHMKCDMMVRLHDVMFYFSLKHRVAYLLITVFLSSERLIRNQKGRTVFLMPKSKMIWSYEGRCALALWICLYNPAVPRWLLYALLV